MKDTLIIPMVQLLILVSAIYTGITRIQVFFLKFTNRPVLVSLTLRASHFYVVVILSVYVQKFKRFNHSNLLKLNFIDYNN